MQAALADVDAAVSRIATLPEDSEAPWVRRVVRYENLLRIVLSGDLPERTLKTWALKMRDGLIRAGVDEVETVGARDEWILVEADQRDLLALDLPVSEISSRIAGASRDIPGGDTGGRTVSRVRSLGLARTAEEVAAVEVRAFPDGRRLTVGEVAEVTEAWNEDQPRIYFEGRPAVELVVKRATTADALETAEAASQFLEGFVPTLPPGIAVHRYDESAELIDQRIDLLVRNGLGGMVIVLVVLFVFLNARTALWVAAGIPAALLAAMALAWALGHSINMVILFGVILAIGLVVDDAIVVAEHAETRARRGDDPLQAAMGHAAAAGNATVRPPAKVTKKAADSAAYQKFLEGEWDKRTPGTARAAEARPAEAAPPQQAAGGLSPEDHAALAQAPPETRAAIDRHLAAHRETYSGVDALAERWGGALASRGVGTRGIRWRTSTAYSKRSTRLRPEARQRKLRLWGESRSITA